jgi:hypothetical protein
MIKSRKVVLFVGGGADGAVVVGSGGDTWGARVLLVADLLEPDRFLRGEHSSSSSSSSIALGRE